MNRIYHFIVERQFFGHSILEYIGAGIGIAFLLWCLFTSVAEDL